MSETDFSAEPPPRPAAFTPGRQPQEKPGPGEKPIRLDLADDDLADDEPRSFSDRLSDTFDEGIGRLFGRSPRKRPPGRRRPRWDAPRIACAFISSLGVLGVLLSLSLDTTVCVEGGGLVHNIGLMHEQQMLLTLSIAAAVAGFIGEMVLRRRD